MFEFDYRKNNTLTHVHHSPSSVPSAKKRFCSIEMVKLVLGSKETGLTVSTGKPVCLVQVDMMCSIFSPDTSARAFQRSSVTVLEYL